MRRASLGNLLNYLTTLAAQVLFARAFGASAAAAAYVITFGLMAAVSGIFVSNVLSIVLPRLLDSEGLLRRGAVRLFAVTAGMAVLIGAVLVIFAAPLATLLSEHAAVSAQQIVNLIRLAAVALVLQVMCGEAAALCLAKHRRFFPAFAPALPSTAVAILLAVDRHADVTLVFSVFLLGSLIELFALLSLAVPGTRVTKAGVGRVGGIAIASLMSGALLGFIPPVERIVAATYSPAGAARYDYASRSLGAGVSILVGGVVLSGLSSWSKMSEAGGVAELRESVARTAFAVALAFCVAASIVLVSAQELVALLFQRGRFTAHDTQAVASLLLILLPGFVAQGVGLVFTSSLSATKRNRAAISVGFANFAVRLSLLMPLGLLFGATGVAVAYSATNCLMTMILLVVSKRLALWPDASGDTVRLLVPIAIGTVGVAFATALGGQVLPSAGRVAIVVAAFVVLWISLTRTNPGLGWRSLVPALRRRSALVPAPPQSTSQ